jgi:hypothetical protein
MTTKSRRTVLVSEPSRTSGDAVRPRHGDVIVSRESASGGTYTIRQAPGDIQLHVSVRDHAIQLARRFAIKAGVNLWYRGDGTDRLLEAYRNKGQGDG